MPDLTTITGISASVFTGLALLPQLVRLVRSKQANGISFLMLVALFIGVALWVGYGVLKHDWIIIISNGFSLIVNSVISTLSLVYKHRSARHQNT